MRYPSETRGLNFYEADLNVQRLLARTAPDMIGRHADALAAFGRWVGEEVDRAAEYTDRYAPPRLETHTRTGDPLGRVVHNPAYQAVHREVYRRGIVGLNYGQSPAPYLLTFAMGYVLAQADISIHCPATLTGAVAYVISRFAPDSIKAACFADLVRMDGDARTGGTWATERDGGSDIGAARTVARATARGTELTGLKWFCSNAGSDLALASARPEGAPPGTEGLGLYLVPRDLADSVPNRYRIRRLKDKLGTRGLATGEIELSGAYALEVAPPPHGFKLMMEALVFSRIHSALAGAGIQRRAFLEAVCHASHRHAFGSTIISFPMVRDILVDIQTELEASVALAFEAARIFDAAQTDEAQRPWLRVLTALAKYRTAEEAVRSASRAIEVVGGIGYTEDYVTSRLLRDAQALPIWEGPPNIQALEILRLVAGGGNVAGRFSDRVEEVVQGLPAALADVAAPVKEALAEWRGALAYLRHAPEQGIHVARRMLDGMSDLMSAILLLKHAAVDLASGDARKAIIAGRYVRRRFGRQEWREIGLGQDISEHCVNAVIAYDPVDNTMLTRAVAVAGKG